MGRASTAANLVTFGEFLEASDRASIHRCQLGLHDYFETNFDNVFLIE